ncbi:MAG: phospholipid/cholesterol/gamma-HCH transport system substrate-binding protein, partial [Spirosomataceae bacterium]
MNSSNKQAVKVGLFIFIGLLIFIVGILTIGSMRK